MSITLLTASSLIQSHLHVVLGISCVSWGTGVLFLVPPRYHEQSLRQMKFFDDNTRSWWTPITGGANVPALNDLLAPHNITLGDRILQGHAEVEGRQILVSRPHSADRQELTGPA